MGRMRLRAWLWLLLGAALMVLMLQQLSIASSHQAVADPTFIARPNILSDGCALPRQELSASLVVVVPPGQVLIEEAVFSWLALRGLEDAVVLHWGSCATAMGGAAAVSMLRQVCVPLSLIHI